MLTLAVLVATALVPPLMLFKEYRWWWTPLQKQYVLTYLLTVRSGAGQYRLLMVRYPKSSTMAVDRDVVPAPASGAPPQLAVPLVLSEPAKHAGARSLGWESFPNVDNTKLHEWLHNDIYDGQSLWELLKVPLEQGTLFLTVLLPLAIGADRKRRRQIQKGRFVRGSQLVSRSQFNRANRSDGIGFATSQLSFWERFRGHRPEVRMVRIPKDEESKHILLMGDSGHDKASLIRQILVQIRARGDTAIVFDPTLAFTPQFYDPAHGDQILNPVDQRMPYWSPSDEVGYVPEVLILVESLFPQQPTQDPFCAQVARRILDQLLRFRPLPQELAHWISHWEEVDRHVAGSEVAGVLERATTSQRAGVQSAFNMVDAALKLLPVEDQGQGRWSAAEWVGERQGWLFLTSTPLFGNRILPLTSWWLDSLILRLMTSAEGGARTVWIILDELGSLQKLPNLARVITAGRNFDIRLVLGFNGRNQIEALYGLEAETILSQPKTKIFLRTSEPRAAEWISQTLGEVEIERLKERDTDSIPTFYEGKRKRKTYSLERRVEQLMLPSEITGLGDRSGYLKLENLVVKADFSYVEAERKQPGFIPRPLPELEALPVPSALPVAARARAHIINSPPSDPSNAPGQPPEKPQSRDEVQQQIVFD